MFELIEGGGLQEKEDAAQYQPRDGASYRLTGSGAAALAADWLSHGGGLRGAVIGVQWGSLGLSCRGKLPL
jgi:hypothetical protein